MIFFRDKVENWHSDETQTILLPRGMVGYWHDTAVWASLSPSVCL